MKKSEYERQMDRQMNSDLLATLLMQSMFGKDASPEEKPDNVIPFPTSEPKDARIAELEARVAELEAKNEILLAGSEIVEFTMDGMTFRLPISAMKSLQENE